ncbi:DUF922 domain-containing Zn-dependent protease [Nitratireductor sp. ZSWI3]|uniref:DUF922 domain-containing Zn-dependent protease n=1 Tax=Nitratireductor sp. ZSWI3 TaxID=2966359 RepID=UPI00214FA20D|nr:DUF922 domain-containing protein [Nitratireductor sp. ZSWI3]MCR4268920.1 DUF922 domain-containing protein [Nitratireductor sp. ZSWI3]
MRRIVLPIVLLAVLAPLPAAAASVSRSYSYFPIGGKTLSDIERQLRSRGPQVQSTGQRHPGATRMEFTTKISYAETQSSCRIARVDVTVKAQVFLPRWRNRRGADRETALIWDTLSRDIKRHEESHIGIAKRFARKIEDVVEALPGRSSCPPLQKAAEERTARILKEHDDAQAHFDRVESHNFEDRMMRLLNYRLEQIGKGRIPG